MTITFCYHIRFALKTYWKSCRFYILSLLFDCHCRFMYTVLFLWNCFSSFTWNVHMKCSHFQCCFDYRTLKLADKVIQQCVTMHLEICMQTQYYLKLCWQHALVANEMYSHCRQYGINLIGNKSNWYRLNAWMDILPQQKPYVSINK